MPFGISFWSNPPFTPRVVLCGLLSFFRLLAQEEDSDSDMHSFRGFLRLAPVSSAGHLSESPALPSELRSAAERLSSSFARWRRREPWSFAERLSASPGCWRRLERLSFMKRVGGERLFGDASRESLPLLRWLTLKGERFGGERRAELRASGKASSNAPRARLR